MENSGDIIWIILAVIMLLSIIVQAVLKRRFTKYSKVPTPDGLTGAQVAEKMLDYYGIHEVKVRSTRGTLTDYYDPRTRTVNLSEGVYGKSTIAAAAVAAHECGHAVQHAQGYAPLRLRSALVPVVNVSNMLVQWVLLAGILLMKIWPGLLWFGIGLFALTTLFAFVTLPVEINASRRAISWLSTSNTVDSRTLPMAQDALKWAAYTYVIAALGSLATLLYYISIAAGNRRR